MLRITQLLFSKKTIITIYNNYSFITSIIQGNNNNSFEPWAYGRFINCAFNPGFGFRVFGTPDMLDVTKDLLCRVKGKQLPRTKWLEYWKSLLDDGIYIQANIDEQYIPGKWAYNAEKYYHDSLVTGYNDEKETFTLFTRLADQNMHVIDVSYSDVIKSYREKGSWFLLYKYISNEVELDVSLIRQELSHYFYSSQSSNFVRGTRYGIKALEYLCEFLMRQRRHNKYMDYRLTRGLTEQKALMFNMCKYLDSHGYSLSENVLMLSEETAEAAQKIHLYALKSLMNAKSNRNLDEHIKKQFDILLDCERKYIPMLLKQLSDY